MCVRSRTGCVVPEVTVRVARASNPQDTTAMAFRDHLNGPWSDEDGRPGLSPAQLATVSVLRFLLELPDRQAAESVRNRIDFKYALGMELAQSLAQTVLCASKINRRPADPQQTRIRPQKPFSLKSRSDPLLRLALCENPGP
ncbi:transposase [Streptomyces sp. NPDC057555]|uniref:transposase n=1 Tax=Streptomyces sp. NPDC057555 TaxID=3346166 RepID=UPI00368B6F04